MKKTSLHVNLPMSIFKEGKTFVAYTPALDLSTCGKTYAQAEKRFAEAVEAFFEELIARGSLKDALLDLGWTKEKKEWKPPTVVAHKIEKVKVNIE